jgi:hypothetical protein
MTSKARQKVDPTIRDMFDSEVDKPDHDRVVMALLKNDAALFSMLATKHEATELGDFTEQSQFRVFDEGDRTSAMGFVDAVKRTGITPKWSNRSSIRLEKKQMETPLLLSNGTGRFTRVVGFIDISANFNLVRAPTVYRSRDGTHNWQANEEAATLLVEVKAIWPTAGNLLRQLNLYNMCIADTFTGSIVKFVLGPDDSMNELLCQHGFRLATFDGQLEKFIVLEDTAVARTVRESGEF